MLGGIEHGEIVFVCQVIRQQAYRRQRDRSLGKQFKNDRPGLRRAGRLNAVVGRVLRQPEALCAIREE
jgi:hypothetical protein